MCENNKASPISPSFLLFSLTSIILLFSSPTYAIRLTNVKHLFDIRGELRAPSDVSVSKDGQIYVVDGVNNKVRIFNRNGKYVSSFGRKGYKRGEFKSPLGIDIDGSGKVYVADSGNHRIQIFDPRGRFVSEIRVGRRNHRPADPADVAVDLAKNRCYVVDNDNHCVLVYDLSTLKFLKTCGGPGTDKRNFMYPFFITLDKNEYVYVVDVLNTRVQVLNPDGEFLTTVGGWGVKKGEFFRPKGVAIDRNKRVYVSDSYMEVIQVFDATGEFHSVLGDTKGAVRKFKTPTGLFIDKNNRLYVVEMFAHKVGVYSIEP